MTSSFTVYFALASSFATIFADPFTLRIIHFNDIHARFDETNEASRDCSKTSTCIAGMPRLYTTVNRLRNEAHNNLVLFAGDLYQGSVWYTLHKWKVSQEFLLKIRPDVMTLGNHEFDDGIDGLVPFLRSTKEQFRAIVSNAVIPDQWKELKQLIRIEPMIKDINGEKIGIIGVLYDQTDKLSNTSDVTFKDSIATVRILSQQLVKQGINKIIVLSHCGIEVDKQIAAEAGDNIDVIVGGHSHTLLHNGEVPSEDVKQCMGEYPIVIKNNNHKVLIVQALAFAKYVGNLSVTFDASGEITNYDGNTILQGHEINREPQMQQLVDKWKKLVIQEASVVVGSTEVTLDDEDCRIRECKIGSALADAYVEHFRQQASNVQTNLAVIHGASFRNPIPVGPITRGQILAAAQFPSFPKVVRLKGRVLKAAFEHAADNTYRGRFNVLQVAGFHVTIDFKNSKGSKTTVEVYEGNKFNELQLEKNYVVIMNSFILKGGDGFDMFANVEVMAIGPVDADVLMEYVRNHNPIKKELLAEERIKVARQ